MKSRVRVALSLGVVLVMLWGTSRMSLRWNPRTGFSDRFSGWQETNPRRCEDFAFTGKLEYSG